MTAPERQARTDASNAVKLTAGEDIELIHKAVRGFVHWYVNTVTDEHVIPTREHGADFFAAADLLSRISVWATESKTSGK